MQKKKSKQIIDSHQVELLPGGDALWAQYKLEMLTLASQKFLNELFSPESTADIDDLVNEFRQAIDAAQDSIEQHDRVVDVVKKLKAERDKYAV